MKEIEKINKIMDQIKYGYVDIDNEFHHGIDAEIEAKYRLQSPTELKTTKCGLCFDQVELERELFKEFNPKAYFIIYYKEPEKVHTHTFLVYENNNKYYMYEHAEEDRRGNHEFDNLNDLLLQAAGWHIKNCIKNRGWTELNHEQLFIHEYQPPPYGIKAREFIMYCINNKPIKIDLKGAMPNEKI